MIIEKNAKEIKDIREHYDNSNKNGEGYLIKKEICDS